MYISPTIKILQGSFYLKVNSLNLGQCLLDKNITLYRKTTHWHPIGCPLENNSSPFWYAPTVSSKGVQVKTVKLKSKSRHQIHVEYRPSVGNICALKFQLHVIGFC